MKFDSKMVDGGESSELFCAEVSDDFLLLFDPDLHPIKYVMDPGPVKEI